MKGSILSLLQEKTTNGNIKALRNNNIETIQEALIQTKTSLKTFLSREVIMRS